MARRQSGEFKLAPSPMTGTGSTFHQDVRDAVERLIQDKRPDMFDAALARWALLDSEIEAILRTKSRRVQCAYRVCGHPAHPPLWGRGSVGSFLSSQACSHDNGRGLTPPLLTQALCSNDHEEKA